MAYYRKQTKNHWARDDPALAVIEVFFLTVTTVAYAVAFGVKGPLTFLVMILRETALDWLLVGLVVATLCR
jgi:hypothetical protein